MSGDESKTAPPKPGRRRRYETPRISRVPLRPDEAVLGACKISGSAGPGSSSCTDLTCSSLGS